MQHICRFWHAKSHFATPWHFSDFRLVKAENQTQSAVLIARARDAKMSDLPRMLHMSSGAKTLIIVADVHNAHRRSCSVGQTLKVETVGHIVLIGVFHSHRHVGINHLVHLIFKHCKFFGRESTWKIIVEFRFFAFHMCGFGASATENLHHRAVQYMFCRVGRRILIFVMSIQNWFFHIIMCKMIFLNNTSCGFTHDKKRVQARGMVNQNVDPSP